MKRRTLKHDLLLWCLGSLTVVWITFIAIGWKTGHDEADEVTDGHLASTAALMAAAGVAQFSPHDAATPPERPDLKAHDYQQSLSVIVWSRDGQLLARSREGPTPEFDRYEGFGTLTMGSPPAEWRMYRRWDAAGERKIAVMTSVREREELADDIALQTILPGLWLLPVIALVLGAAIRRGLRPLFQMSSAVGALEVSRPEVLRGELRHEEFKDMVRAINALVQRYDAALGRERDIAGELAHELRTPLASIALHAHEAREHGGEAARMRSLSRLEADALRAGEVLTQLLSLARASHARQSETASPVDILQLAQGVVAECAPAAHQTGHELALARTDAFPLVGHAVLLQVALRNLLENAIAHTPPGTLVEVQFDGRARWLQVCDNGLAREGQKACGGALGLGLGHRVVAKVAELHGATFSSVHAPAGFTSCYRLSFAPSAST